MINEYIQSVENYKGFVLKIRLFRFDSCKSGWHRECEIYRNQKRIAISKTKKEAKDLIDNNLFKED